MATTGLPGIDFPGVGVGLLILRDGKILLCRRLKAPEIGFWNIPGGKLDFMERAAEAARRETHEETGLVIGEVRFLGVDERVFENDQHHWISLLYATEDFAGEARIMEPEKHSGLEWFALDALPDQLSEFAKTAIRLL